MGSSPPPRSVQLSTKWPSIVYSDMFSLGFDSLLNAIVLQQLIMRSGFHIPIISSKAVTDHIFALESLSYINPFTAKLSQKQISTKFLNLIL